MNAHTVILSTTKTEITKDSSCDTIAHLINRGIAMVDYFGVELDNDADYIADDMKDVSNDITYIEIHFETEEPIDYDSLNEVEVDNLILDLLANTENKEVRCFGKDITLYMHHK